MALQRQIGLWNDVSMEVAAWDGVTASVDLSCACMFEHEVGGGKMTGGLLHLDTALNGALSDARRSSAFRGASDETWLIEHPSPPVLAGTVLIIGLGDPRAWVPSVSAEAAATAVRIAIQRRVASCAFAPSLLDAGLDRGTIAGAAQAMMAAALNTLAVLASQVEAGLAPAYPLKRWIFDVGAAHFDQTAEQLQLVLASSAKASVTRN